MQEERRKLELKRQRKLQKGRGPGVKVIDATSQDMIGISNVGAGVKAMNWRIYICVLTSMYVSVHTYMIWLSVVDYRQHHLSL